MARVCDISTPAPLPPQPSSRRQKEGLYEASDRLSHKKNTKYRREVEMRTLEPQNQGPNATTEGTSSATLAHEVETTGPTRAETRRGTLDRGQGPEGRGSENGVELADALRHAEIHLLQALWHLLGERSHLHDMVYAAYTTLGRARRELAP